MPRPRPVMLMILDGWGLGPETDTNAVFMAQTPNLDRLTRQYPTTRLLTSGRAVGLPDGIMGNSEVGHLNLGAGRVVYQDLLRIDMAIEDGSFFENPVLLELVSKLVASGGRLHLMGLVSDGGVHSQFNHLLALLELARRNGLKQVYIHAILDGRDTPPTNGAGYLEKLAAKAAEIGTGQIATVCGRFWAMDRDTRWDRIQRAYDLYTLGQGQLVADPVSAVRQAYKNDETDEFIQPMAVSGPDGKPLAVVEDGDGIIFFNFRADRAREITRAFTADDFEHFRRKRRPKLAGFVCMTIYDEQFNLPVAFPPEHLEDILGEVVSRRGLRQLRIAETEKYAHVTYFFNGGEETPFEGEDRCLIPSPRQVATYDQKPEMSARQVTDEVLQRIASNVYDLIVLNFANMDMVGHTGIFEAAVKACETVDQCVGRIVPKVLEKDGVLLITADHGNAETMVGPDGRPHTAHTTNPVRLILMDESRKNTALRQGVLGDVAPTICRLMELDQPEKMTGGCLFSS